MGIKRQENAFRKSIINFALFLVGLIFIAFLSTVIGMFLAPQYFDVCIFENNCGGIDEHVLSCDLLDPTDPCNSSNGAKCSSKSWDANNECCESGYVDMCGICDGTATSIDRYGLCCSGVIDASGSCCYEEINPWGVCGINNKNGSIVFNANVTTEFSLVLGELMAHMGNLHESQIVFVEGGSQDLIVSDRNTIRRLQSQESCSEEHESCSSVKKVYNPSSTSSNWSSGVFILKPAANGESNQDILSLSAINEILAKLSKCYCHSISQLSDASPISVCGNKQCEEHETCSGIEEENCCIEDCPVLLASCPSVNSKECSQNGVCVSSTGNCNCWEGYSGRACEECDAGYSLDQSLNICLRQVKLGVNKTDISAFPKEPPKDKDTGSDMKGPPEITKDSHPPENNPTDSSEPLATNYPPPPPPLPPIMWREVGKLYRDLHFDHGPSLSFGIEFNPTTRQVYLGFQDLGDPSEASRPSIVKFDGKNWHLVGERGGACEKGSRPRPDPRYFFDYKVQLVDGKEKLFAGTFDMSDHKARSFEYNEDDGMWVKIVNFFVYYYEIPGYSGSIIIWEKDDYPIFAMSDEDGQMTHIFQYNFDNQTWKTLQFGPFVSNRRKFTFVRNRYNDQLYISGCDNVYRTEMYPRVYRFEAYTNKWENITKPNDVPNPKAFGWECRFSALAFDGYGNPVSAYISTKNEQKTVNILVYDEYNEEWIQKAEISKSDLPGAENHYRAFWDGARFAMDQEGGIYLYFRTHYFSGLSWPVIDVVAQLWILVFDKYNLESWTIMPNDFVKVPGPFPLAEVALNADSTLGHLTFDPDGILYYAFCRDSFRVSPLCPDKSASHNFCGNHVQSRCVPTVYRLWHY